MYSKGSKEIKQWMENLSSLYKNNYKFVNEDENDNENEDDDKRTPFDVLEKIRDICNKNLKDPEDDTEIEKILKSVSEELKSYMEPEQDKEPEEKKPMIKFQPQQQQQDDMPEPEIPTGTGQDIGAPGSDLGTAAGMGLEPTPPSGGQM